MYPYYESNNNYCKVLKYTDLIFPEHVHSHLEFSMITEGSIINRVNGIEYILNVGDMIVIFPYIAHSAHKINDISNKGTTLLCPAVYAGCYFKQIIDYAPTCPVIRANEINQDIKYLYDQLSSKYENNIDEKLAAVMIELITGRVLQQCSLMQNKFKDSYSITYKIINYITENYNENINLDMLSKKLGTSKSHLSYVFSKHLGTNFREFLNSLRVSRSCELLLRTDMTVTEVLTSCGFDSPRTFNRAFKKVYGMSPSAYRYSSQKTV